jgi:adenosylcobinamide-GDP ribazoletransferase
MTARLRRGLSGATSAITFLTILPVRTRDGTADAAPGWFALVGALLGAVAAGIYAGSEELWGAPVAAILAVVALVILTGGLHLDGLADCADGLGVRGARERRLQAMRDPAIGSFGALALLLWGLLLTVSLAQFSTHDAVRALICAPALGRWAALLHARWAPAARHDGLGSAFSPSTLSVVIAGLSAAALAVAADPESAGPAVLVSLLVAAGVSALSQRALGGRTGDTLGATVVLAELGVVLLLLAFARG